MSKKNDIVPANAGNLLRDLKSLIEQGRSQKFAVVFPDFEIVAPLVRQLRVHSPVGYAGIGTLLRSFLSSFLQRSSVPLLRSYSETKLVLILNCVAAGVTNMQSNLLTTV
jgi:hypothetical protein